MSPARIAILLAVLAAGLLAVGGAARVVPGPWSAPDDEAPQDASPGVLGTLEQWTEALYMEVHDMPQAPTYSAAQANRRAFLAMIAACEGTDRAGDYACLYGSTPSRPKTFASFADHPRIAQRISATDQRWTTAAGRYQFMAISPIPTGGSTRVDTWDRIKKKLGLPDFGPESQDRAALELIREAGALGDVDAGRVLDAARKCRGIWASLPGAGYSQPERGESFVLAQYQAAGGALA